MPNELIKIENGACLLDSAISVKIAEFEHIAKEIKAKEDELKQMLIAEMEDKGILKIDTEELVISYVAPSTRETFDSKKLRADNPNLYDEYIKISPVSSSIRIKVKGE